MGGHKDGVARARVEVPRHRVDVEVPFMRAPKLELPKGGGAVRGIGETIKASTFTGTSSLGIPLPLPEGRGGFGPKLSLSYDSGTGNGAFGLGFSLGLLEVRRKTERGLPHYDDRDVLALTGADELVIARDAARGAITWDVTLHGRAFRVQVLRPRSDVQFSRIERWTPAPGGTSFFVVRTAENVTHVLGRTAGGRIADPSDPTRVLSWLVEASWDGRGNRIAYEYAAEDGTGLGAAINDLARTQRSVSAQRYLKRIFYGNRAMSAGFEGDLEPPRAEDFLVEVAFDYGDHADDAPTPAPTRSWSTRPDPFSSYRAGFELRTLRRCRRVLCFHRFPELGDAPALVRSLELTYEDDPRLSLVRKATVVTFEHQGSSLVRAELPSLELDYSRGDVTSAIKTVAASDRPGLPVGLATGPATPTVVQWVDLEGDGLAGALTEVDGAAYFHQNLGGGRLAAPRVLKQLPPAEEAYRLLDLGADGGLDWVTFSGRTRGSYARDDRGGWRPFLPFEWTPTIDLAQPHLHFIDLDGDGRADLLIGEEELALWHPSAGRRGFEAGRRVHWDDPAERPELVSIDQRHAIFVADMTGDGLADIVRVRSGDVTYWPNLGHGRFGGPIRMAAPPRVEGVFDPRRVRLADVDGTGPADLLYLAEGDAQLFYNQAGNSFAAAVALPFPSVDALSTVQVVDLEGTGTACLVWSSAGPQHEERTLRYVDLFGGRKPYLLESVQNGLGLETRLRYAPSTRFVLEDRRAGAPWLSRLPMVVHVVEREEIFDHVTRTRLVRTYRYRHGHYDRSEREVAGFGFVEQWDAEAFDVHLSVPTGASNEGELRAPPVRTRTWFATGAEHDRSYREGIEREFYAGAPQRLALVAEGRSDDPKEERDAARAMRGRPLRVETYAEDGTTLAGHPYEVRQSSPATRMLQPRQGDAPSCHFAFEEESLLVHLERSPADARIEQTLTLEVDDFGNVVRTLHVAHGRSAGLAPVEPEQRATLASVEEHRFANRAIQRDGYRVRVATESTKYQLFGLTPAPGSLVSAPSLRAALPALVAGAADPSGLRVERVAGVRHRFYREDLAGPLPHGQIEPRSLPFESYHLALGADLIATHVQPAMSPSDLAAQGGYALDGGELWVRNGRPSYDPARFYAVVSVVEPTGNVVKVDHDPHVWFATRVTSSSDPTLASQVTASHDYRVLAPKQIEDENGNRSAVVFDVMGRPSRLALMGKVGTSEGDTLDDPTARFSYDLLAWQREKAPAWTKVEQRTFHRTAQSLPRWEAAYRIHRWLREGGAQEDPRRARCRLDHGALDRQRPCGARQQGPRDQGVRAVLVDERGVRG